MVSITSRNEELGDAPGEVDAAHFFAYHDEEFIEVVYRILLGREPDPSGMRAHVSQLRMGISRMEILYTVSRSDEAFERNVNLTGLRGYATYRKVLRWPVVGTLVTLVMLVVRAKKVVRNMRAMHNHLYRLSRERMASRPEQDQ